MFVDVIFTHWIFLWEEKALFKNYFTFVKINYEYFEIKIELPERHVYMVPWLGTIVSYPRNKKTLFILVTIINIVNDEISERILQCSESLQSNVKL